MMVIERLSEALQKNNEYVEHLIDNRKKYENCFTDVWLTTCYGYPSLEHHKQVAAELEPVAKKLRDNGIGVSMQLANSIGHGQYMAARDCSALKNELKNAQRLIGHNGKVGEYTFCWRDPDFHKYLTEEIGYYMRSVKPDELWIDDDLRARNHAPVDFGCFCDKCIAKFDKNLDRETLLEEFLHGDIAVREKWISFIREGIAELTRVICRAVKDNSPDTCVCLQNGPNGIYTGHGHDYIFDAIYEVIGKAPKYRAGADTYRDHDPNEITEKVYNLAFQNSKLPDYVTCRCPEIENTPNNVSGKTMYGTALEATMQLANGSTDVSFAMLGVLPEQKEFYDRGFKLFSQHNSYWNKLAKISEKTYSGGVYYAHSKKAFLRELKKEDDIFAFNKEYFDSAIGLLRNNMPISYEERGCDVCLLHPEAAMQMTVEELKALCSKNVVTDGYTVEYMQSKGIDLGFAFRDFAIMDGHTVGEQYTDHPVNKVYKNIFRSGIFSPGFGGYRFLLKHPENCEIVGKYSTGETSAVIFNTEKGGRWAVMGYGLWKLITPTYQKERLFNIIDAVAKLPARIASPVQAILMPRVSKENGKTLAVSVTNCTIEGQEDVKVLIRNPESENFLFVTYKGEQKLDYEKTQDGYIVTIPALDSWSIGTVFCNK